MDNNTYHVHFLRSCSNGILELAVVASSLAPDFWLVRVLAAPSVLTDSPTDW